MFFSILKEAKDIIEDESLGGTRSETAAVKKAEGDVVSPKRASTMQKTAQVRFKICLKR